MTRSWLSSAIFSVRSFTAALLALWIAFSLDLSRPSLAMMTVYIVSQPLSGMTRSKGAYRILGTLAGAVFSVIAVPNLVNAPLLLCLALAGWLGMCLYASIMDGTARGYAFMLAGYTAAIISFPSVNVPQAIFDTALSRTEEICLGIVCVLLVSYLPFSERVGSLLRRQLTKWIEDARHWATDVLKGVPSEHVRLKLIDDTVQIDQLRLHARYDTPEMRRMEVNVIELQHQMQQYFSLLTSIEEDYARLKTQYPDRFSSVEPLLGDITQWLEENPSTEKQHELNIAVQDLKPDSLQIREDRGALLLYGLLTHLQTFMNVRQQCRDLMNSIEAGETNKKPKRSFMRHRDHAQAMSAGAAAILCLLACCAFWIFSGWPEGAGACVMAAVVCSFFATLDNPVPAVVQFVVMINVGVAGGLVYQLMILPHVDGFASLGIVLALFYLPLGVFMAQPRYFPIVMPFVIGVTAQMSLETRYNADIAAALNGAIAQALGMSLAGVTLKLTRATSGGVVIQRLLRANQNDLRKITASSTALTQDDFTSRVADRIAGIVKRSNAGDPASLAPIKTGLRDLQTGTAIFQLRELKSQLANAQSGVNEFLNNLSRHFDGNILLGTEQIELLKSELAIDHSDAADKALLALDDIVHGIQLPERQVA